MELKRATAALATAVVTALLLGVLPTAVPAQSDPQSVGVKAREFVFDPREITVRAGKITLSVTNEGGIEHALVLEDESHTVLAEIPSVLPEKTEQTRVTQAPGTYAFFCPVGSGFHRRRGMVGKLTVTQ